jgi:uncharacterized membrane protein YqjE
VSAETSATLERLRRIAANALAMAEVRLELLSLDAQDALARALLVFCLVACAVVALALGVVFLAVLVTVLLWDSHRVLALALGAGAFLGLGALAAWGAVLSLRRSPGWFAASLAEIRADRQQLGGAP